MSTALTTNNPLGIGFRTGVFSGTPGEAIDQHFFNAAFAGRINENKIYKEAYHCNIVQQCGMAQWLEQYMGYDTDCFPDYSLIETYGDLDQVEVEGAATVPTYPSTVVVHLAANSHFVGGSFILPQVGNTGILPNGVLVKITAVSTASAADSTMTVQLRDHTGNTAAFALADGDKILILPGSEIADCACPTGQFRVPDLPIITDLSMYLFGDKGEVCGDAVNKCQWLKIPFSDDCGNTYDHWYTEALQRMYQDHEKAKAYERLLNPYFGMIPGVKARGIKWVPASTTEITTDDVRNWKSLLDLNGINCREFAIFAGKTLFSQWQRMLLAAGVSQLQYIDRPLADCGWINLDYCGIKVEGLTLHIYEECMFSNGKQLGSQNSVFPASAIIIPMCARPTCTRSDNRPEAGSQDNKMLSTVYFRSNDGRVWDNLTDSNGIFGPRNTFGTGCEKHEWTVKSKFLQEVHCANFWGYMGL